MREVLEGLAIVAANPAVCSAIVTIQLAAFAAGILLALHCVWGVIRISALKRTWEPAADHRLRRVYVAAGQSARFQHPPVLRAAPGVGGACTVGFGRVDVCIDPAFAERLDDHELKAVFLHELAHVRRRDALGEVLMSFGVWTGVALVLTGFVAAIAAGSDPQHLGVIRSRTAILGAIGSFFAVRFLVARPGHRLRELTCDDQAVAWSADPCALASAIVKAAQSTHPGGPVSALRRNDSFTVRRIERLVDYRVPVWRLRLQRAASAFGIGLLILLVISVA